MRAQYDGAHGEAPCWQGVPKPQNVVAQAADVFDRVFFMIRDGRAT